MNEVYIGIMLSNGTVAHMAFQTVGRFPTAPTSGGWSLQPQGIYIRVANDENIKQEVNRLAPVLAVDDVNILSWRRLSDEEHEMFSTNRQHRNALEDVDGKISHNMVKAREIHKELLRHVGIEKLLMLDGKYNGAIAQSKDEQADSIEADRQSIRDVFDDPRIEAATTLEELKQVQVPDVESLSKIAKR